MNGDKLRILIVFIGVTAVMLFGNVVVIGKGTPLGEVNSNYKEIKCSNKASWSQCSLILSFVNTQKDSLFLYSLLDCDSAFNAQNLSVRSQNE